MKFSERLKAALDLTPPHAGILRALTSSGGVSQQALAGRLGVLPSRLVALVDELESRGREAFWMCRTRFSESKVSGAKMEKALAMAATFRNVTTVRKLALKTVTETR